MLAVNFIPWIYEARRTSRSATTAACRLTAASNSRGGNDGVPRSTWRPTNQYEDATAPSYITIIRFFTGSSCLVSSVEYKLVRIPQTHLEQVDDPGGFPATYSNRLQDKAAGHHLPSDGVHTGTRQRLLEHGL